MIGPDRWGILSDIHGNLPALERALATFQARGVEHIAVLGDNLGRGDSDGCVRLIRQVADVSVVGNRDLDWQDRVGADSKAYVLGLPPLAVVDGIAFSHGDARLTRELSTGDVRTRFSRASAWLAANDCRVWFFGHSHYARIWRLATPDRPCELVYDVVRDGVAATVSLRDGAERGTRWAVNVGSVGLPFPGKGPASATIYDAEAGRLELVPVSPGA
jgi:predicted phosphodiesterase